MSKKKKPIKGRKPAKPTHARTSAKPSKAKSSKAKRRIPGEKLALDNPRIDPKRIVIGKRFRRDFGDVDSVVASIEARGGLIQPIALTPRAELIAGERRLRAWKRSKFSADPIPYYVLDVDNILSGEWDENAVRKDFTPSEAVEIMRALEPIEKAKAAARVAEARKRTGTVPPEKKGRARDQVAKLAGIDRRTLEKAAAIVDAAEADPAKFGKLREQMDATGKVSGSHKRLVVMQQADAIRAEPSPLPMQGPYRVGVGDVPWPENDKEGNPGDRGRAFFPYATMSLTEIAAMGPDVRKMLCEDAWFWFWIPSFHLAKGYHLPILKEWDLEPVAIRTWVKPHFGHGQLMRGQTEHVILCRRGNPPPINLTNQSTLLEGPASGEHSSKPAKFFEDVEAMCPAPRYAYLFAGRIVPPNWDGHGDRVGKIAPADARAAEAELLAEAKGGEDKPARQMRGDTDDMQSPAETLGDDLAEALATIDAGGTADAETVRGLRIKQFIKGKTNLTISALGQKYLAAARIKASKDAAIKASLADLPDDLDAMVADYRATIIKHHHAVLGANDDARVEYFARLRNLEIKAHGGTHSGAATDESPAARLRNENRAPIGEVPAWGQIGMFQVDVDGVPYIVTIDDVESFNAYAVDGEKPCISNSGFRGFVALFGANDDEPSPPAMPVDEACANVIRAEVAYLTTGTKKKKPEGLHKPERFYRLPASYDEATKPINVSGFLSTLDETRTMTLVDPKTLPSSAAVKRIADRAAARGAAS